MSAATARPVQDWATLTVGEEFGPYRFEVGAELVAEYRAVTGDHEVVSVDGVAVAPPTILTFPVLQLVEDKYAPRPGGIHASQDFEFLAPVRVGAVLAVTGVLVEMALKRGRRYFTVASTVRDDRGVEVARGRMVGLYPDVDVAEAAEGGSGGAG